MGAPPAAPAPSDHPLLFVAPKLRDPVRLCQGLPWNVTNGAVAALPQHRDGVRAVSLPGPYRA